MADRLTELAGDAERAAAPDFDGVVARARTQRRHRQVALAIVAAAVVAGGTAVATSLPDHAESSPPVTQHPSPSPTPHRFTAEERIQQALDKGETRLVAAADPRHVLIVREYCPRRQHCWWGSEINGVPESRKPASQVHQGPVSAGSAGFLDGFQARFLRLDGTTREIGTGPRVPLAKVGRPTSDAVFEMADDGAFTVYEPVHHRWWSRGLPLTAPPIQHLLLTDGGQIWMQQSDGDSRNIVSSSDDGGRTWTHHRLPVLHEGGYYGPMLWHAGTIGVQVFGDDGTLTSLRVLDGSRWVVVPVTGTPLEGISDRRSTGSVAGLANGRLNVANGQFWQAAPESWTRWTDRGSAPAGLRLTASRDVLLGTTGSRQVWVYEDGEWRAVD